VPNGHRDEIGDTVAIAKKTGAKTVSPFELGTWFISKGVPEAQVVRRHPGGRLVWEGITIRVVGSVHGSGSGRPVDSDVAPIDGGAAAGFMITLENGWAVYSPGSSAATQDMALWAAPAGRSSTPAVKSSAYTISGSARTAKRRGLAWRSLSTS
jgi:L-ascorbate metabolism protein UlaG (beta-lactamase superfamily)